jgi:hypothetical protein
VQLLALARLCFYRVQPGIERALGVFQLIKQFRAD